MSLQDAIQKLSKDAVKLANGSKVVGLGSGSTVAFIVKEMSKLPEKESMEFVPTSLQIKIEAEKGSLKIADESRIPDIDIVFDGVKGFKTRCTCGERLTPLCKHVLGAFGYLEFHYNRYYFSRFKPYTAEKNKIICWINSGAPPN